MAKTTIAGVEAAMKILYPKGEMPEAVNDETVFHKALKKAEDFKGQSAYVAIKHANPQGIGKTVADAQTAYNDAAFKRFNLTRSKFFATARIDGEAAEAAEETEGALVDLVEDKVSGTAQSFVVDLAVYDYGAGNAVRGELLTVASAPTYALSSDTNMNYFEFGMYLEVVEDETLATTVKSAAARYITAIDREGKTITMNAAFGGTAAIGDFLVRSSMEATAGASTYHGLDSYIAGGSVGSPPADLYSMVRSGDITRLAGRAEDYTGEAPEDAVLDMCAKVSVGGVGSPDTLVCGPVEASTMKRSVGGRVVYNRDKSSSAGHGFKDLIFETEAGQIPILVDPFCPANKAFLVRKKDWTLWSLRKAPHMEKVDGLKYLRVSDDDAFEVRWKFYGALKCTNPAPQAKLTGFGA